jgi:protein O-GlcNAc transferase
MKYHAQKNGSARTAPPPSPQQRALARGLEHHKAGRLADAEAAYRQILAADPAYAPALNLLGSLADQVGHHAAAVELISQAIRIEPIAPSYHNNLGVAHQNLGQLEAAAGSYERALALQPDRVDALSNLGVVLQELGQPEEALSSFERSLKLRPNNPDVLNNVGALYLTLKQLDEAEARIRRALKLRPGYTEALNNLGNVMVARRRWDEAVTLLTQVVQQAPDYSNGWINLGHALKGSERFQEACAAYERFLALSPGLPAGLMGLGDALQGRGEYQRALACYEQAHGDPALVLDLHERRASALLRLGRLRDAEDVYRRYLEIDPAAARVHSELIFTLDLREGAEAEAWHERQRWNAHFGPRPGATRAPHTNRPDPDRPLRVGYVSADFRQHSAGFGILPILRAHDHSRVTVICYSGVTKRDDLTEQFRSLADVWHDVHDLSDDALEALIRADEIDILVDLSGHSAGNRLPVFAREPAPAQVTAWGYATGTGLETMHYFLADPVVVPPEAHDFYVEEIVNLPSLICYESPDGLPPVVAPPAVARGYVTFGAFNRPEKISPSVRDVWAAILARLPDARLLLKSGRLIDDPTNHQIVDHLVARGIDRDRIELLGNTQHLEHLVAHGEIDILLDTFPHGGGITSIEALLMGVPVVTLLGERVAGRLAASFLTTLGLDDLIARTPDEYLEIAARLAGDLERLTHERATLRERLLATPIANGRRYTEALEGAYRQVWQRWCHQQAERSEYTRDE